MQLPPVLSPLDRPVALFILLALLSVFEPVLVLLAVGHGGSFEGDSCTQLLVGNSLGLSKVGPAQVGLSQEDPAQVGPAQVGTAQGRVDQVGLSQVGPAQEGPSQVGPSQVGTAQDGPEQVGPSQVGLFETNKVVAPLDQPTFIKKGLFFVDLPDSNKNWRTLRFRPLSSLPSTVSVLAGATVLRLSPGCALCTGRSLSVSSWDIPSRYPCSASS
jgi:hypothetical protein